MLQLGVCIARFVSLKVWPLVYPHYNCQANMFDCFVTLINRPMALCSVKMVNMNEMA